MILKGDKTTADGVVLDGVTAGFNNGTPLAYHGASIICPTCKSTGRIVGAGPSWPMTFDGLQVALENDLCICQCNPPPRLLASQDDMFMTFESHELAGMGFHSDGAGQLQGRSNVFDEQVRAVGAGASEGYPYYIETSDGQVLTGNLDANGQLPRVFTSSDTDYHVYWGDEALEKMAGD